MILPDVLETGLKVVFCGTAASAVSARLGAYYANPGNAFWRTLHSVGLTPLRLQPADFQALPRYGIGLTDLVKVESGVDATLSPAAFDVPGFRAKIIHYRPAVVAFTSKRAGGEYYGRRIGYGCQPEPIGESLVFVLPSPSGAARRYWDAAQWQALADLVRDRAR